MGRTVDELQDAMSAQEFGEWMAFYSIHPFGPPGEWFQSGVIASTIANVNRAPNTEAYKPADFIPRRQAEEKPVEDDPNEFFGKVNNG
jgi:hypothetical protein